MTRLEYQPALDGLRGACLLAVLFFHSGFAWMSGGFLGVSTFFTLSGYLITTLLLAERDATGTISLRRFWERRLRRLLPASLVTIAAIVATAPLWLTAAQRERLAEDALATTFYAVNWRFMRPEYAYDLIFVDPSPFQHFWSLAIEGQFYLVFPLIAGLVLRLGGGARGLAIVVGVATLASIATSFGGTTLEEAQHRLYYGTDARAAELLIGALLALASHARGRDTSTIASALASAQDDGRRALVLRVLGPLAAVLVLIAWSRASVADAWLYRGGFAGYALLSAILIAAATAPAGVVRRALSARWLRWIGTVSYGAYLFHWPIFLYLTEARTGLGPLPLLAVRLAATFGLAALSYRFVERPVRRTTVLPGRRFAWSASAAVLLVAAIAIASNPVAILVRALLVANDVRQLVGAPAPQRGLRVAMFGDSTALSLWNGLGPYLRNEAGWQPLKGALELGCGVLAYGQMENRGVWMDDPAKCHGIVERWATTAREQQLDVAIVLIGPWEARTRRRHPRDRAQKLGDPELDAATRDAIAAAADALASSGAAVVWLTAPHIRVPPLEGRSYPSDRDTSEPERMDRVNELIREVAAERPDTMRVVDLAGALQRRPGGEFDQAIRADDVHFTKEGAASVVRDGVGAEIQRAVAELRAARD